MKSSPESAATAKSAAESPSEPRADSDEDAVHEVARPPVAIRRARIRIITKVAVRTDGRRTIRAIISVVVSAIVAVVLRLHASYRNKKQRTQQRKIFHVSHNLDLVSDSAPRFYTRASWKAPGKITLENCLGKLPTLTKPVPRGKVSRLKYLKIGRIFTI
jgi:hypothetical protein